MEAIHQQNYHCSDVKSWYHHHLWYSNTFWSHLTFRLDVLVQSPVTDVWLYVKKLQPDVLGGCHSCYISKSGTEWWSIFLGYLRQWKQFTTKTTDLLTSKADIIIIIKPPITDVLLIIVRCYSQMFGTHARYWNLVLNDFFFWIFDSIKAIW